MYKILLTLGLGLVLVAAAQAQVSYGLKAGVNLGKYSNPSDFEKDYQKNNTSFYVTGFADLLVAPQFSIQPGVSLQGKGQKFEFNDLTTSANVISIEIPVNAVYYIPAGTGNIFLGAGPYVGFNVSGKRKENRLVGGDGIVDTNEDIKFGNGDRETKVVEAGANFMAGYKFGNGLLINAGYGLGLTNLSNNPDDKFSNRVLSFGVGFQF